MEYGNFYLFMGVFLQTTTGVCKAHDICQRITQHLDLWKVGKYTAFIADNMAESRY